MASLMRISFLRRLRPLHRAEFNATATCSSNTQSIEIYSVWDNRIRLRHSFHQVHTNMSVLQPKTVQKTMEATHPLAKSRIRNLSTKYDSLYTESCVFLERLAKNDLDVTTKTKEIVRLTEEWATILGKGVSEIEFWSMRHTSLSPSVSHAPDKNVKKDLIKNDAQVADVQSVVEIVDQLAHALLDVKEKVDDENDRTRYFLTLNLSMTFWSKNPPSPLNGARAEKLLSRMERLGMLSDASDKRHCYAIAMNAWTNSVDSNRYSHANYFDGDDAGVPSTNGALQALRLLEKLECTPLVQPTLEMYNGCIHAFAIRGMVREAEEILKKVEKLSETDANLTPDVKTYSSCLNAYQKQSGKHIEGEPLAKRAEVLLERMMKNYKKTGDIKYRPNQVTFGTVISLVAKSSTKTAAEDADGILQSLIDLYEKEVKSQDDDVGYDYSLQPGTGHFVSVFLAYQKKKSKVGWRRIEELLVQMDRLHEDGNDKVKPNNQCFMIYIDSLTKSGNLDKAEEVLGKLEGLLAEDTSFELNNYGYNQVMAALGKGLRTGRAKRVEAILSRMNDLAIRTGNQSILPDKYSYTSLMDAILNDRQAGYIERCEDVLAKMASGTENMKPDAVAYNCMMKAYLYGKRPEDAEAILERMERNGLNPNSFCYRRIMQEYSRSRGQGCVEKVISLLERMENNPSIKLSGLDYAVCLQAISNWNDQRRVYQAEAIFERFLEHSKQAREPGTSRLSAFHSLQNVYGLSHDAEKAKKSLNVIKMMEGHGVKPNTKSFNNVIEACSRVPDHADEEEKSNASEIAAKIIQYLRSNNGLNPDPYTYSNLLWVCNTISSPQEKRETIEAVFKICCKDGYLEGCVLGSLKQVASDQFWSLVGRKKGHVDVKSLDPSWSRNAHDKLTN